MENWYISGGRLKSPGMPGFETGIRNGQLFSNVQSVRWETLELSHVAPSFRKTLYGLCWSCSGMNCHAFPSPGGILQVGNIWSCWRRCSAPAVWIREGHMVLQVYSLRPWNSTNLLFAAAVPPGQGLGTLARYTGVSRAVPVLWIKRAFQSSVWSV